jgi:Na+/phosphate symporter
VSAISKADLKQYQEALASALRQLSGQVQLACRALNRNKKEPATARAGKATEGTPADADRERTIFGWISEGLEQGLSEEDLAELLRLRSVLAFVRGVAQPVGQLTECVDKKIDQQALFSDAAVREANDLFSKSQFLLDCCADAVQTRNPLLKSHVLGGAEFVLDLVQRYTEAHQARRASGACSPQSAGIFVCMIEQFRMIVRYLKEIASHIPAEVELETWTCPRRTGDRREERA